MTTDETMVRVGDVDLCVQTFGADTDPPILLVMGAGASMLHWDAEFCERLAAGGRHVVRYDHRDTGRSTAWPAGEPDYALRDLVADAVGLLEVLGLGPVHLVGMSMGAAIGQLVALEHPDTVRTTTLMSGSPGGPGHEASDLPGMSAEIVASFAEEPVLPVWSDRDAVIEYLLEGERSVAAPGGFDEQRWRAVSARSFDRTVDIAAMATNHFMIDPGAPWRDRLGGLTRPTLVVHGTDDPMFPYAHGVALAREVPGATLLPMPGAGHEPPPPRLWDDVIPSLLAHTAQDRPAAGPAA